MVYLIIIGIIAFAWVSVRYVKNKESNLDLQNPFGKAEGEPDTTEDSPVGFGYKCQWLAVKTDKQDEVAQLIGLQDIKKSNWKSGIDAGYKDLVFVTPAVDGWTLVVGVSMSFADTENDGLEEVKNLLNQLSTKYGEAQYFCTHRVVEYHCWIKSSNGKTDRVYAFLGERGENIEVLGEPTEAEKGYEFFNSFSEEAKSEGYYDRMDLTYADEELVMEIAGKWSVNPVLLDERNEVNGLGLLGRLH